MEYCNQQKVLSLTLQRVPFDLMERGSKPVEYREGKPWIASRLEGKRYTHVRFTNGYSAASPFFVAEYGGFVKSKRAFRKVYDCGLVVDVKPGDYIIILGKVIDRGNLQSAPVATKTYVKTKLRRIVRHKVW